jgi:tRNA pseudouridine32 synthase/23S rRNA pseudouridine746 synthase/23S rRNA pseudouridine1911/1915/1917 synthase
MRESKNDFERPPRRHQPKGLSILYEDRDILVVDKVSGLLTVSNDKVKDNTAYCRLTDYVRKGNYKSRRRVFIVHRLDRDTSGIIVFAKNGNAKRYLQDEWQKFEKKYYAVVHGKLPDKEGIISSYLVENSAHRMYSVTNPKAGKLARTGYRVLRVSRKYSLLEIDLLTGRKNQIRVHLADKGCSVAGDKKYGEVTKGIRRLMLHAASISIVHPHSKERMTFATEVPAYFESLIKVRRKRRARRK